MHIREESKETLLVFDLDETLIKYPGYEGSEAWYDERLNHFLAKGMNRWHAIEKANEAWEKLQDTINPVLIQPDAIEVLFRLHQQQKIHTVVITARRKELAPITHRQLANVGLSFNKKNFIFTGPHAVKGPSLESYLVSLPNRPCHCICVDDRKHQIDSYFQTFETLRPSLTGTLLHMSAVV